MKLFLIILLCINFVKAQDNHVEYQFILNGENQYSEYLSFNEKEAYYFMQGGYFDEEKNIPIQKLISNINVDKFRTNSLILDDVLIESVGINGDKKLFSKEERPRIDWKIQKEKKEILGYDCTKAIGKFRGRTYTVWFASAFTSQFGPWKLCGLPGLILEAIDNEYQYRYIAKSLLLNSKIQLPGFAIEKFKYMLLNTTPLKEVIEIQNEDLRNSISKYIASEPNFKNIQVPPIRNMMKEKIFEWETSPAKF